MENQTNFEPSMRDWSAGDRAELLRSIPAPKRQKEVFLAPGMSARGICGTDVSILDRRSVKAQLAGRGDFRAAWWSLNQKVHQVLNPRATLEEVMFAFHKRHHAVTLFLLGVANDFSNLFHAIRDEGSCAAVRYAACELRKPHGSDR